MRSYREYLEEVREANPIREVVSQHVALTGLIGRCPFHPDQTPSFRVNPDRGTFKCFGASCQVSGDVFQFVELHERVDFREAVARLADRAQLPPYTPTASDLAEVVSTRDLEEMIDLASIYYRQALTPEAREYVTRRRKLPEAMLDQYRIGWADGRLAGTMAARFGDRVIPILQKAGLIRPAYDSWVGLPWVDRFESRVMMAAMRDGRAVFLSGRAWSDGEPKYLHQMGREAPLFNEEIVAAEARVMVTEGPFDAMSLVAWGYPAVAFFGGVRPGSLAHLKRCPRVLAVFDGDAAGRGATLKLGMALGPSLWVVTLPKGWDPNDFYVRGTRDQFQRRVDAAVPVAEWFLRPGMDTTLTEVARVKALDPWFQFLATLTPSLAAGYLLDAKAALRWPGSMARAAEQTVALYRRVERCSACGAVLGGGQSSGGRHERGR